MNAHFDRNAELDTMLSAEDAGDPVDAWSLDELDRFADLDSVRAARSRTDDGGD
jgi:hypothetical protein